MQRNATMGATTPTVWQQADMARQALAHRADAQGILQSSYPAIVAATGGDLGAAQIVAAEFVQRCAEDPQFRSCDPAYLEAVVLLAASTGLSLSRASGHLACITYGRPEVRLQVQGLVALAIRNLNLQAPPSVGILWAAEVEAGVSFDPGDHSRAPAKLAPTQGGEHRRTLWTAQEAEAIDRFEAECEELDRICGTTSKSRGRGLGLPDNWEDPLRHLTLVWATLTRSNGLHQTVVMYPRQIARRRARSESWARLEREGKSSPWVWMYEMVKKTAMRRLLTDHSVQLHTRARDALRVFDGEADGLDASGRLHAAAAYLEAQRVQVQVEPDEAGPEPRVSVEAQPTGIEAQRRAEAERRGVLWDVLCDEMDLKGLAPAMATEEQFIAFMDYCAKHRGRG